tara:strand:- start:796 stop:1356 length:561 start_codon:yes stop_codon:yes gene_type:complete
MTTLSEKRGQANSVRTHNQLTTEALIHNQTLVTIHELERLNTSIDTINGNTPYPFNPNTPSTWTNSRLGIILTQQVDGTQITKIKAQRVEANLLNGEILTPHTLWGTAIDCNEYSSIRVMGTATDAFNIYGSIDDVTYYKIDVVTPDTNPNHLDQFNYLLESPPRYIKIKNGSSTITITLDYSLMN